MSRNITAPEIYLAIFTTYELIRYCSRSKVSFVDIVFVTPRLRQCG